MTPADIVAYIGAAAWIPQIVAWITRSLATPKLKLVFAPRFDVTYNHLGPYVSLTTAISSNRRDALVESIQLVVKHSNGETRTFRWKSISQHQFQIQGLGPEIGSFSQRHLALAIKVPTTSLADAVIQFQTADFELKFEEISAKLFEEYVYLKSSSNLDPLVGLMNTKTYRDADSFFLTRCFGRKGCTDVRFGSRKLSQEDPTLNISTFGYTEATWND